MAITTNLFFTNGRLGTSHFVTFFRSLCDRLNKQTQYEQAIHLTSKLALSKDNFYSFLFLNGLLIDGEAA